MKGIKLKKRYLLFILMLICLLFPVTGLATFDEEEELLNVNRGMENQRGEHPLLVLLLEFNNQKFTPIVGRENESVKEEDYWTNKFFGTQYKGKDLPSVINIDNNYEHQKYSVNDYYHDATGGLIQFTPFKTNISDKTTQLDTPNGKAVVNVLSEGIVKVSLPSEHPNTQFGTDFSHLTDEEIHNLFTSSKARNNEQASVEEALNVLYQLEGFKEQLNGLANNNKVISVRDLKLHVVFSGETSSMRNPGLSKVEYKMWPNATSRALNLNDDESKRVITGMSTSTEMYGKHTGREESSIFFLSPLGTIVHELGHRLDLRDLYFETYNESGSVKSSGLKQTSVMANSDGAREYFHEIGGSEEESGVISTQREQSGGTPVHFDAYSKIQLGLLDEGQLIEIESNDFKDKEKLTVQIGSIFDKTNFKIIKINTPNPNKYYLIENRERHNFDYSLETYYKNSGIVIYFVDYKSFPYISYLENNSNSSSPFYHKENDKNAKWSYDTVPSTSYDTGKYLNFSVEVKSEPGRVMEVEIEKNSINNEVKTFGTAQYRFDEETGTLTFLQGQLPDSSVSKNIKNDIENSLKGTKIKRIDIVSNAVKVSPNMSYLFSDLIELEEINGFEKLDTSKVVDMSYLFANDVSLKNVDVSKIDVSQVQAFQGMFLKNKALKKIDTSKWKVENVRDISYMFSEAESIKQLNLSYFNLNNIAENKATNLFHGLSNLESIILGTNSNFTHLTNVGLPEVQPSDNKFGDGWLNIETGTEFTSSKDLLKRYNGSLAGYPGEYERIKSEGNFIGVFGNVKYEYHLKNKTLEIKGSVDGKEAYFPDLKSSNSLYNQVKKDIGDKVKIEPKVIMFTEPVKLNENSPYLFEKFETVEEFVNLDFLNVKDLKIGSFMFYNMKNLKKLDVTFFEKQGTKLQDASAMFQNLINLEEIELGTLGTNQLKYLYGTFQGNSKLKKLDISRLDTKNVISMSQIFQHMSSLEKLNISNLYVYQYPSYQYDSMFKGTDNLKEIILGKTSNFKTRKDVLIGLDKNKTDTWTNKETNKTFKNFYDLLEHYDGSHAGKYVKGEYIEDNKFGITYSYEKHSNKLVISGGTLTSGTTVNQILSSIDIDKSKLKEIEFTGKVNVSTSANSLFSNLKELERIEGLEYLDTSDVTDMSYMFAYNEKLKELDLSNLDTRKVKNMEYMFLDTKNMESINLSNLDTSNVENMNGMFFNNSKIQELDLSSFKTEKVKNMMSMFGYMQRLEILDISNFNMKHMGILNGRDARSNLYQGTYFKKIHLGKDYREPKYSNDIRFPNGVWGNKENKAMYTFLGDYDGSKPGWYERENYFLNLK